MCLAKNLKKVDFNKSSEMQSALLRIIGQMPVELFSASDSVIYTDREGLESAVGLVEKIGHDEV